MKTNKIKFVATAVLWRDKINGNTYHSVRIVRIKDGRVIKAPFQYGYGEHYKTTALEKMYDSKWLPRTYNKRNCYTYARNDREAIVWTVYTGTRKECEQNGKTEE